MEKRGEDEREEEGEGEGEGDEKSKQAKKGHEGGCWAICPP